MTPTPLIVLPPPLPPSFSPTNLFADAQIDARTKQLGCAAIDARTNQPSHTTASIVKPEGLPPVMGRCHICTRWIATSALNVQPSPCRLVDLDGLARTMPLAMNAQQMCTPNALCRMCAYNSLCFHLIQFQVYG